MAGQAAKDVREAEMHIHIGGGLLPTSSFLEMHLAKGVKGEGKDTWASRFDGERLRAELIFMDIL